VDETGSYAFRVEGSVHEDAIQWRFREQLAGPPQPKVVAHARVEGTINGNNDMFVRFIEGADQAFIEMKQVRDR
jgi:hypothetical protein